MPKVALPPNCHQCESRYRSVFCDLEPVQLNEINEHKDFISFGKGQTVFNQGFRPQGLFCISKGKVKIHQLGNEGKDQIVRLAKEGDIIGYRALISGENYSGSATALDDVMVCLIPKSVFFQLLEKNSKLSFSIMNLLSHDLEKAEQRITDLAQKPVRERLAEALLFLKETYGFEPDSHTLNVSMSREEIANLVGTARETAIRLLSELKNEHILDLEGKKIKILNLSELIKVANVYD